MKKIIRLLILSIVTIPSGYVMGQEQSVELKDAISYGSTQHIQAVEKIRASNLVESKSKVHYEAGQSVTMLPGFSTEKGTAFKASIGKVTPSANAESLAVSLNASPNPFAESTEIQFYLPQAGKVSLSVSNITGIEVTRLIDDEYKEAGMHKVKFEGNNKVSGVYLYTLKTERSVISNKMSKF
ncbi:3-coathanger stack domain-containing protein [Flectobacillus major]|uniref:3-coathanger stack domain-containing protein n=1 Tax=Flectobacillus major TaxID=103 RepID=UPI0004186F8A|nr:3-coathanger stack domain-containing protein [Flectobacillus major]